MSSVLPERAPAGWLQLRFDQLVTRSKESGRPDWQPLSVFLGDGVVPRSSRHDNHNRLGADLSNYLAVRPGDIVFNKLRTWQGGLGVSQHQGIVSPAYFVCRPRAEIDSRYYHYLLRSQIYLAELTRVSKFMPPSQFDIAWEDLRTLPVLVPPREKQRSIADYLDTETARIDALITKKRRMVELLEERRECLFNDALASRNCAFPDSLEHHRVRDMMVPISWRVPKLSSVLRQLTNGYVGPTRDILREEGVRYIQGLHVKRGRIDFNRRPYYVNSAWHEARPRTALQPGDVVIVQTGDIGQCAVIPGNFGAANCHALLIARCDQRVATGPYLAAYLQSDFGQHSLRRLATGALHPHLEFGIRDARIVLPPLEAQDEIVREVTRAQGHIDQVATRLKEQLDLLIERRQALITAAVTGGISIPKAA